MNRTVEALLSSGSVQATAGDPLVRRKLLLWNQGGATQLHVVTLGTLASTDGVIRHSLVCYLQRTGTSEATPLISGMFSSRLAAVARCATLVHGYTSLALCHDTVEEEEVAARALAPIEQARQYAIDNGLTTTSKWLAKENKPKGMPSRPDLFYKVTWSEFVGKTDRFLPLAEARQLVIELGIKSVHEYRLMGRNGIRPVCLPAGPQEYYGSAWRGWNYFLGKESQSLSHIAQTEEGVG